MDIYHVPLKTKPIDPNRAKYWAVGLCLLAAIVAVMTVKTNYDYFGAYYEGYAFWMRFLGFSVVELTIILLPAFKGWGNPKQITAMYCFEAALLILAIIHTSYTASATGTRVAASKSKSAAKADFDVLNSAAAGASQRNAQREARYNQALVTWRRAAADARYLNQPVPTAPQPPQLETVPQIDQKVLNTATLDVEGAVEESVPHVFLLRLLYVMVGVVILAWTALYSLSDAARLRLHLLLQRGQKLNAQMKIEQEVVKLGDGQRHQTPVERVTADENPFPRELPESESKNGLRR